MAPAVGHHALISIHSLRVEGDVNAHKDQQRCHNFNPLPPCGGRRCSDARARLHLNFNPLPPCGGRLLVGELAKILKHFNPLPPCGGRHWTILSNSSFSDFNPLPPCGGRRVNR